MKYTKKHRLVLFVLFPIISSLLLCGCSRGYISSYRDNARRSFCSLTEASIEYAGFAPLYAQGMCVPGEGASLDVGSVSAAGLFDLGSGKTLVEENITKRLYPASTTKIMTALLAIKHIREHGDADKVLKASSRVAGLEWEAQRIGIEKGDTMTLDQALHYLMVYSANDAAILIAENVGEDYDDFIRMMNEEARRIGATRTHFVNPHGLHDNDHYTTAYDLFLIFQECIRYQEFRDLICLDYYSTVFHDRRGNIRAIEVPSTDSYLRGTVKAPAKIHVIGGKTGTTDQAGSCLIILSQDDEQREYVSVIMGSPDYERLYVSMNGLLRAARAR